MSDVTPLLRSPLLAEILQLLLLEGGRWTSDELADATGAPYPTVTKEVRRLERTGVVVVEVVGRTKFVTAATTDPTTRALGRLVRLGLPARGGDDMAKKKDKKKDKKKKK